MTATMLKRSGARSELTPLLTIKDLERLFHVDKRTISRLCKKGQIPPPLKVGGSNRWRADEIARVFGLSSQGDLHHDWQATVD